jgi:hypothetical protein
MLESQYRNIVTAGDGKWSFTIWRSTMFSEKEARRILRMLVSDTEPVFVINELAKVIREEAIKVPSDDGGVALNKLADDLQELAK